MDDERPRRSRILPPVRNSPLAAAKVQRTFREIVDPSHVRNNLVLALETDSNSDSWREYRADGGADRDARFARQWRKTSTRSSSPGGEIAVGERERERRSERERGATAAGSREMHLAGLYVRTHPRGRRQGAGSCRGWLRRLRNRGTACGNAYPTWSFPSPLVPLSPPLPLLLFLLSYKCFFRFYYARTDALFIPVRLH